MAYFFGVGSFLSDMTVGKVTFVGQPQSMQHIFLDCMYAECLDAFHLLLLHWVKGSEFHLGGSVHRCVKGVGLMDAWLHNVSLHNLL